MEEAMGCVTARQRTEAHQETYAERFRTLAWLMASASLFDMQALAGEDATARTRWHVFSRWPVIAANPDLDVDRIRRWVREFSAALDMPEMQENLETQLRRRLR